MALETSQNSIKTKDYRALNQDPMTDGIFGISNMGSYMRLRVYKVR